MKGDFEIQCQNCGDILDIYNPRCRQCGRVFVETENFIENLTINL